MSTAQKGEDDALKFQLGDVVSLNSHPYFRGINSILISGETASLSPLMVITESVVGNQSRLDKAAGKRLTSGIKHKCIYYSKSSLKFEEKWIDQLMLKLIQPHEISLDEGEFKGGALVTLKTSHLEVNKRKSSMQSEINNHKNNRADKVSVTNLMQHVPPVMQVCGIVREGSKEPLFNKKAEKSIRRRSKVKVKCQWFNPKQDKLSEFLFPLEAISLLEQPSIEELEAVSAIIKDKKFIRSKDLRSEETIIKPLEIRYLEGNYSVVAFDYIKNQIEDYPVMSISDEDRLDKPHDAEFPDITVFKEISSKEPKESSAIWAGKLQSFLEETAKAKRIIRIHYKDINDRMTVRTVDNYFIEEGKIITGFCHLREEQRTFKLGRIQRVEVLKLTYKKK